MTHRVWVKRVLGILVLLGIVTSLVAVVVGWTTFTVASGAVTIIAAGAWGLQAVRARPAKIQGQPDLRLEQVGDLGYQKGSPSEYVKAKWRLVNGGGGVARNWQVSVSNLGTPGVTLARLPRRGPKQVSPVVSWHQDVSIGEVPAEQERELPDWLWVEGPPTLSQVHLGLSIRAQGVSPKNGKVIVTFPSGPEGPNIRFEL